MPRYPIDADKLLSAAEVLVPARTGRGRPAYTAHRRGVSTAYYAVFHAIGARVTEQVFPMADATFRDRVRRWIGHGDIKAVASWIGQLQGTIPGTPPRHIAVLLGPSATPFIDAATGALADGFLELHEKREQADYDHDAVFTRPDTLGLIALARQTVDLATTGNSDELRLFFGLVAMQSRVQAR